jgi:hypothetical protein
MKPRVFSILPRSVFERQRLNVEKSEKEKGKNDSGGRKIPIGGDTSTAKPSAMLPSGDFPRPESGSRIWPEKTDLRTQHVSSSAVLVEMKGDLSSTEHHPAPTKSPEEVEVYLLEVDDNDDMSDDNDMFISDTKRRRSDDDDVGIGEKTKTGSNGVSVSSLSSFEFEEDKQSSRKRLRTGDLAVTGFALDHSHSHRPRPRPRHRPRSSEEDPIVKRRKHSSEFEEEGDGEEGEDGSDDDDDDANCQRIHDSEDEEIPVLDVNFEEEEEGEGESKSLPVIWIGKPIESPPIHVIEMSVIPASSHFYSMMLIYAHKRNAVIGSVQREMFLSLWTCRRPLTVRTTSIRDALHDFFPDQFQRSHQKIVSSPSSMMDVEEGCLNEQDEELDFLESRVNFKSMDAHLKSILSSMLGAAEFAVDGMTSVLGAIDEMHVADAERGRMMKKMDEGKLNLFCMKKCDHVPFRDWMEHICEILVGITEILLSDERSMQITSVLECYTRRHHTLSQPLHGNGGTRSSLFDDAIQIIGERDKIINNLMEMKHFKETELKDFHPRVFHEGYDRLMEQTSVLEDMRKNLVSHMSSSRMIEDASHTICQSLSQFVKYSECLEWVTRLPPGMDGPTDVLVVEPLNDGMGEDSRMMDGETCCASNTSFLKEFQFISCLLTMTDNVLNVAHLTSAQLHDANDSLLQTTPWHFATECDLELEKHRKMQFDDIIGVVKSCVMVRLDKMDTHLQLMDKIKEDGINTLYGTSRSYQRQEEETRREDHPVDKDQEMQMQWSSIFENETRGKIRISLVDLMTLTFYAGRQCWEKIYVTNFYLVHGIRLLPASILCPSEHLKSSSMEDSLTALKTIVDEVIVTMPVSDAIEETRACCEELCNCLVSISSQCGTDRVVMDTQQPIHGEDVSLERKEEEEEENSDLLPTLYHKIHTCVEMTLSATKKDDGLRVYEACVDDTLLHLRQLFIHIYEKSAGYRH